MLLGNVVTWGIAGLSTAGVILRPLRLPEAVWAIAGALALVCLGLLPLSAALFGARQGMDVYFFLVGMMVLSEVARQEGLFDWLAACAARIARGSAVRLFGLIYGVGVIVTAFLSNDATAVVLTPAVAAMTRAAKIDQPMPYLLVCALIANAASFVLPISNPANLVIYRQHMPALLEWLPRFALPSVLSIVATYLVLRWTQRKALRESIAADVAVQVLSTGGKTAAVGILATALLLMIASACSFDLGAPTLGAGVLTLVAVCILSRSRPWGVLRAVSWGVIPLVAGLFILVEALDRSGVIQSLAAHLHEYVLRAPQTTSLASGIAVAVTSNVINNLPAGLMAGAAIQAAQVPDSVSSAVLIGVDLGPNLSVTGSLATILWLTALRRDGIEAKAWDFLKVGLLVMPPALILSLWGLLALN